MGINSSIFSSIFRLPYFCLPNKLYIFIIIIIIQITCTVNQAHFINTLVMHSTLISVTPYLCCSYLPYPTSPKYTSTYILPYPTEMVNSYVPTVGAALYICCPTYTRLIPFNPNFRTPTPEMVNSYEEGGRRVLNLYCPLSVLPLPTPPLPTPRLTTPHLPYPPPHTYTPPYPLQRW